MNEDWISRVTYNLVRVGTLFAAAALIVGVLRLTGVLR